MLDDPLHLELFGGLGPAAFANMGFQPEGRKVNNIPQSQLRLKLTLASRSLWQKWTVDHHCRNGMPFDVAGNEYMGCLLHLFNSVSRFEQCHSENPMAMSFTFFFMLATGQASRAQIVSPVTNWIHRLAGPTHAFAALLRSSSGTRGRFCRPLCILVLGSVIATEDLHALNARINAEISGCGVCMVCMVCRCSDVINGACDKR